MKKKVGSLLIAFMMVMTMVPSLAFAETETPDGIPITEEYFPDPTFRNKLIQMEKKPDMWEPAEYEYQVYDDTRSFTVNGNGDGYLSNDEIADIKGFIFGGGLTSLEGIQYLTSLKSLTVINGSFEYVPELPKTLGWLKLCDGKLKALDTSKLSDLVVLYCYNNELTGTLDVSSASNLTVLEANENKLTSVAINGKALLDEGTFDVRYNSMKSTSDIKNLPTDYYEGYDYDFWPQGEKVDVEINAENFPDEQLRKVLTEIEKTYGEYGSDESYSFYVYCNGNGILEANELDDIEVLDFSDDKTITNLKGLEYLQALETLNINSGSFDSVSNLPISLEYLRLKRCDLTAVDVSHLPNLKVLDVRYNNIPGRDAVIGFEADEYDEDFDYGDDYKFIRFYPQGQIEAITVDEEHFPDKAFRDYISNVLDDNEDGILSVSEIENIEGLSVYDSGIQSLEGMQYFPYIESLDCSDNYLTEIPDLPAGLTSLNCDNNLLSELPQLPGKLDYLRCEGNKLTTLPEIPDTLTYLYCPNNNLGSLPELPKALEYLHCGTNKLTSLPSLSHTSITELQCYENKINALPELPNGLKEICCSYNKIKELPELPETIETLDCNDNEIAKLPALPKTIKYLDASDNKLTGTLDISQQMFLKTVYLDENILTGLIVSDKAKYEYVSLYSNYFASKKAVTGRSDIDWEDVFYFGTQKTYCEVYGHSLSKTKVSKAYVGQSYSYSGSKYKECSRCGYDTRFEDKDEKIPEVKSIKLSASSYTYNGKAKKPTVTVYDANDKKISSSNYTVSYASGRKNVGKYKVTVKFKGNYTGSRYVTFKINPKGTTISKVTAAKKGFTVKWKKQTGKMATSRITGYQYRYSTSSKMTNAVTKTVKGYGKTSAKKTGLKAKKTYYVQVRTYKTVKGVKYYSPWSKAKTVKTK